MVRKAFYLRDGLMSRKVAERLIRQFCDIAYEHKGVSQLFFSMAVNIFCYRQSEARFCVIWLLQPHHI